MNLKCKGVKNISIEQAMFTDYPDVVTVSEMTKMLRIGKNKAYELIKDKKVHSRFIGQKILITKASIINFIMHTESN